MERLTTTFSAIVVVLIVVSSVPLPGHSQSPDQWLEQALTSIEQVKPGVTRRELELVFRPQAGLARREGQTYVYRGSRYIKVDVELEIAPDAGLESDIVKAISRPYLARPVHN